MKGLRVSIFDSGFSDFLSPIREAKNATIINEGCAVFDVSSDAPAVKLVRRSLFGSEYIHAEPIEPGMYAFGGRFVYCSDSRFRELNKYPIPLHDRDMSKEGNWK